MRYTPLRRKFANKFSAVYNLNGSIDASDSLNCEHRKDVGYIKRCVASFLYTLKDRGQLLYCLFAELRRAYHSTDQ